MSHSIDKSLSIWSLFDRFQAPDDDLSYEICRVQHMVMTRQMLPMGLINLIAVLIVSVMIIPEIGLGWSLLWALPLTAIGLFQIFSWYSYQGKPVPSRISGNALRRGEKMTLIAGSCWGSAPVYLGSDLSAELMLFILVVLSGMVSGLVSLLAPLPRYNARFVICGFSPILPFSLMTGHSYTIGISCLCFLLMIALINSSLDSYRQLVKSTQRNLQSIKSRNNLVDAIESTHDAFALFNSDRKILLVNKRHEAWFGSPENSSLKFDEKAGTRTIEHKGQWLLQSVHTTMNGGYVVVHTDVTSIKTKQRELQEARREAEEADLSKTRFLSTMSHELRMPLQLILSFSRLMASDSKVQLEPAEISEYADTIRENGTHLLRLIDDIIDYSKIGLDKMLVSAKDVRIDSLISETLKIAANYEKWDDLSGVEIHISQRLGALRIDETICQRILVNLISNAMRFSDKQKKLVIRADLDAEEVPFISIRDFGCGIAEDQLERVFEPFYQIEDDAQSGRGGTGLGLTLSRQLAQLHDGDVVLRSRAGIGTTAILVLPGSTHLQFPDDKGEAEHIRQVA